MITSTCRQLSCSEYETMSEYKKTHFQMNAVFGKCYIIYSNIIAFPKGACATFQGSYLQAPLSRVSGVSRNFFGGGGGGLKK